MKEETHMREHLQKIREHLKEQALQKLEGHKQNLLLQKERALVQAKEHQNGEIREIERIRMQKKLEMRLQQER
jgi:hypothetical protein